VTCPPTAAGQRPPCGEKKRANGESPRGEKKGLRSQGVQKKKKTQMMGPREIQHQKEKEEKKGAELAKKGTDLSSSKTITEKKIPPGSPSG